MENVFMEQLDQLYWPGYGQEFKEDNPDAFYQQLTEFTNTYQFQQHEVSNALSDGAGCRAIRPSKHKRHGKRGGNTGDLFAQ